MWSLLRSGHHIVVESLLDALVAHGQDEGVLVPFQPESERTDDMTPKPLGGGLVGHHIADGVVDLGGEWRLANRAGPDLFGDHENLLVWVEQLIYSLHYTLKYSKSQIFE